MREPQRVSTHPNAILQLTIRPNGLTRQTWRAMIDDAGARVDEDPQVEIGGVKYSILAMETNWHDDYQVGAEEGDIVLFDMMTYGFGERIAFTEVKARADALDAWARAACEKYNCASFEIHVTANYWQNGRPT
jgi:hypothetical protein